MIGERACKFQMEEKLVNVHPAWSRSSKPED